MIYQYFSLFFWNFLKLNRGDLICLWEPVLQNDWIICSLFLCFNSRNLRGWNFSPFIRFQWVLNDSAVLFSIFWIFIKLKNMELISWVEPILQNSCNVRSALLYFSFRNLKHPNFSSFIRFQLVLHDSAALCSIFWNFLKLKRGNLMSWWEPILQSDWIIWSYVLYFNSKNLGDSNSSSLIWF